MKILLASSSSGSHGDGELSLLHLGRALAQRGHAVTLWASEHSRMDELANSFSGFGEVLRSPYQNTYDHRGRSITSYLNLRTVRQLASEWQRVQPDLLHLNKQNIEDGLDLLQAARRSRLPSLCTIHIARSPQLLKARLAGARDFVARRGLGNYPGRLVTVDEKQRRHLIEFLGETQRIHTIPNGVPLPDLARRAAARDLKRAELGLRAGDFLLVAVGRLTAQERPLYFLERARLILGVLPGAKFVWIGDGLLEEAWDEWVAAHGLQQAIQRLPWRNDVPLFLLAADAFVHVAESEGLPLAMLEAMAAALPCFVTSKLREEVPTLNASNSILIDDDLAWREALGHQGELPALGAAARRIAEESFSCATVAASYETLYEETLTAA